jgi:hypothetical protein
VNICEEKNPYEIICEGKERKKTYVNRKENPYKKREQRRNI